MRVPHSQTEQRRQFTSTSSTRLRHRQDYESNASTPLHGDSGGNATRRELPASATFFSPASKVTSSNRLKLSEGLCCVDYLPTFRALAVGSTRQIHIVEVVHSIAQGTTANVRGDTTCPFALRNAGVFGSLLKVEAVAWYPSTTEASLAFVQLGRSVTILLDVLAFKADGTYIPQQWVRSQVKSKALNAVTAAGSGTTNVAVSAYVTPGFTPYTTSVPSSSNAPSAGTSSSFSQSFHPSGMPVYPDHGGPPVSCVIRERKGPHAKELIELNIDISLVRVDQIAWDLHNPYTLAITSNTTHFELWQIPVEGSRIFAPQLILRPPAVRTRCLVRDIAFSPSDVNLIVVMTEVGNEGCVMLYDRRHVEVPATLRTVGPCLAAAFHPLFSDLLAVCYRKEKTKPDCRLAFYRVVSDPLNTLHVDTQENAVGISRDSTLSLTIRTPSATVSSTPRKGSSQECSSAFSQDLLPAIDYCACVSQLRWRPPSCGVMAPASSSSVAPSRASVLEALSKPDMIGSQLWLATAAVTTDVDISVWDAANGYLPVGAVHYQTKEGREPMDFVWVNELTLVAVFKGSEIIITSLLYSQKHEEIRAPEGHAMACDVPSDSGKLAKLPSLRQGDGACTATDAATSSGDQASSISIMNGNALVGHAKSGSSTASVKPGGSNNGMHIVREGVLSEHDDSAGMFSLHWVLPTASVAADLFGRSFVVRNSSAALKLYYARVIQRESRQLVQRLVELEAMEEARRQQWVEVRSRYPRDSKKWVLLLVPYLGHLLNFPLRCLHRSSEGPSVDTAPGQEGQLRQLNTISTEAHVAQLVSQGDIRPAAASVALGPPTPPWGFLKSSIAASPSPVSSSETPSCSSPHSVSRKQNALSKLGQLFGWRERDGTPEAIPAKLPNTPETDVTMGKANSRATLKSPVVGRAGSAGGRVIASEDRTTDTRITPLLAQMNSPPGGISTTEFASSLRVGVVERPFGGYIHLFPLLRSLTPEHGGVDLASSAPKDDAGTQQGTTLGPTHTLDRKENKSSRAISSPRHRIATPVSVASATQVGGQAPEKQWASHNVPSCISMLPEVSHPHNELAGQGDTDGKLANAVCGERPQFTSLSQFCPRIESFVTTNAVCGWAYAERLSEEDTFIRYALEWDMGYELALSIKRLRHHRDDVAELHQQGDSYSLPPTVNLPGNAREPGKRPTDSVEWVHACSPSAASPILHFSERETDSRFALMMEKNALICEMQERKLHEQPQPLHWPCTTSAATTSGGLRSTPDPHVGAEGQQPPDPRADWWRATACAWRSHQIPLIISITTTLLEYASLVGDVQYCLVLYVLFCLWWRLRHQHLREEGEDGEVGRCDGGHNESRSVESSVMRSSPVADGRMDSSHSVPVRSHHRAHPSNSAPCPLLPEHDKGIPIPIATSQGSTRADPSGTSSPPSCAPVTNSSNYCSPQQWKQRALQWLEAYTARLYARELYVPLNELLLIIPEIMQEPCNPIQPRASDIAYEKQMTYVFCGYCPKSELYAQLHRDPLAFVAGPSPSFLTSQVRRTQSLEKVRASEKPPWKGKKGALPRRAPPTATSAAVSSHHHVRLLPHNEDEGSSGESLESSTSSTGWYNHSCGSVSPSSCENIALAGVSSAAAGPRTERSTIRSEKGTKQGLHEGLTAQPVPCSSEPTNAHRYPASEGVVPQPLFTAESTVHSSQLPRSDRGSCSDHPVQRVRAPEVAISASATPLPDNAVCRRCCRTTTMSCVICEEVVEGIYYWLRSCGHGGHVHHLEEWLRESNECPRCGVPITSATKKENNSKQILWRGV